MVQAPTPSSAREIDVDRILRVDREHLIHPLYHPADHVQPMVVVRGEGTDIIDARGNRYFDALSGLWNVHVGHGRTELAQVAAEQMGTLAFNNNRSEERRVGKEEESRCARDGCKKGRHDG